MKFDIELRKCGCVFILSKKPEEMYHHHEFCKEHKAELKRDKCVVLSKPNILLDVYNNVMVTSIIK